MKVQIHLFLTSVQSGGKGSASCCGCFDPERENKKFSGPKSQSESFRETKNFLLLRGTEKRK